MLLTEDQARTKWCPHARVVEVDDDQLHGPFNRYHPNADANFSGVAKCIASGCMAWRIGAHKGQEFTVSAEHADALIHHGCETVARNAGPFETDVTVRRVVDLGFCGLAGQVE